MNRHEKIFSLFCLTVVAWMIAGCGNLYRINYSNIKADLNYSGSRSVSVGVLDERPYILSGENDPKYVGTMRGGYGNPFDLWTQSDLSLADEMAATVAETLRGKGFKVLIVKAAAGKDGSGLLPEMKSSGAERLVLMEVKDWWSNYYPKSFGAEKTELIMDVELKVMDRNQRVLGSSRLKGVAIPPSGWPKDTIPGFYQKKMTELLNDKGIQKALR
jgi:hypothetical protein